MILNYKVTLADILLLFIYIEIIGMIKEYWISKSDTNELPSFHSNDGISQNDYHAT